MRRFLTTLAALGLAATGLAFAPATAANAGTSDCSGSLVLSKPLNYSGTKIGELDIYYTASTGVNCAKMVHLGPTYGVSRETYVYIAKCQQTTNTGTCYEQADDYQDGNYSYFAAAKVTAGSHCITSVGWINWDGAHREVATGATVLCG